MEAWRSSPSLGSAASTTIVAGCALTRAAGADYGSESNDELDAADSSDDDGASDYVIDISTSDDTSARDELLSASAAWQPSVRSSGAADSRAAALPTQDADPAAHVSPKRFARAHRSRTPDDDLVDTSCSRCKSNLNGKLIVQCASCAFRCHLYCFSPPLKQHPAYAEHVKVTSQGTTVRVRPSAAAIAAWSCERCRRKIAPNQRLTERTTSPLEGSGPGLQRSNAPWSRSQGECAKDRRKLDNGAAAPPSPPRHVLTQGTQRTSGEREGHPVQTQWRDEALKGFDWYAFREEKAKAVGASASSVTASPTKLVYYSKPFAEMKATALSWRDRVVQRRREEHQRVQREWKKRVPPKRDVMMTLTARELELIEHTLMRRQREIEVETALFDDSHTYDFDMSLERIRRLRAPRQSVVPVQDSASGECEDSSSIGLILNEIAEAVALSLEDSDVQVSDAGVVADTDGIRSLAMPNDAAAAVVQTMCIRWRYKTRRLVQLQQQLAAVERQRMERSARAKASVRRLQLCICFIMLLVRNVRCAHTKRELLLALQTSSEDTKAVSAAADDVERKATLAQRRIQRFFVRRVRPYICLKKRVMSRRILRWWKRKFFTWKWRVIAQDARLQRRERASRTIQRAYRRFRTKRAFAMVLEKHALRKIKTALRSWLMARVVKKEKMRVAIHACAASFGVLSSDALSTLRDAPVDAILFALGSALYSFGAFWSAAAVLERAWKLNPGGASWTDQLALAYSHHMTWYSSYDSYNLTQAYEMYCAVVNDFAKRSTGSELSAIDPFILQDTAVVLMQMENFGGSLRMLARLIECFPQYDGFPLWLLLAAVQLQQRGEWTQSVEYLTYLQDMPPSPYLERDILSLCAIALERQGHDAQARSASKEAWSAAIRQWSLAQKTKNVLQKMEAHGADLWSESGHSAASTVRSRSVQSTHRKWEMLHDFAQRAATQGHYLLACRLMLYMLEIRPDGDDTESDAARSERASVWWSLADVFRHLGHLDLYVDATARSYQCIESGAVDPDRRDEWRRNANVQAQSFRSDVENLPTLELFEKLRVQFMTTPET